jgi:ABC-type lipoprotein export system ATPase subunit
MIVVENISKNFRSGKGRAAALSHVSFSIDAGKTLTVLGKSGSGKTTLLNCVGGLEKPDSGHIRCFGVSINTLSAKAASRFQRKYVGFVFQSGNLLSYLNVTENLSFPLVLNGINGKEKEKRISELLDRIGLAHAAGAMPDELSGGELQRVAFARAIAHFPKMLLADEPTASLDSETGLNLVNLMMALSSNHGCILIVSTHDREIIRLSDNKLFLMDGKAMPDHDEASS